VELKLKKMMKSREKCKNLELYSSPMWNEIDTLEYSRP
jgi:hypothetical protein